jgi:hypothetical protein
MIIALAVIGGITLAGGAVVGGSLWIVSKMKPGDVP